MFQYSFWLCLLYKNYTCGKKDTTRCREKRQLPYEPALRGSFPPAFTAPVPISIPLPQPCPHWLCHMNHPPQHLLKLLFQQPDTLAPRSLPYKLRCISSSRSSHIGCQAGFPDFPSLGGCSAVELAHWFLSGVAFLLFYRNCYLFRWCS